MGELFPREKKQKIKGRSHLPRGFVFPERISRDDDAFGCGQRAQARDQKLPGNDKNHGPRGDRLMRGEADERGSGQNFVGQRIHELAEISHEVLPPGDLAIEPVRESGHHEQRKGSGKAVGKVHRKADNKNCGESEPRERQAVREIHANAASGKNPVTNLQRLRLVGRRGRARRRCIFPRSGGAKPIPRGLIHARLSQANQ